MDNPPPYSEVGPANTSNPAGVPNVNPIHLTYAMEQPRPMHFVQAPQQMQPGQPLPGSQPTIGFQPAYLPAQQNVAGQPVYPPQMGKNQPNIYETPAYADENAYRNVPSDVNPLTSPGSIEGAQNESLVQFNFDNASIRRAFIKKVYSLVMVQLLITIAFIALFMNHRPAREFVRDHSEVLIIAFVVYLVTAFSMSCCEAPRRAYPYNFIFLGLFTLSLSLLMGVVATNYDSVEVLMAAGVTAAICLALTLFAFQTKYDFTGAGLYLFCLFIPLFFFGIYAGVSGNPSARLLYAALGVVLFSCYLVYDTQLMIGGKHKYAISPEDYVFAALTIYLDIMIIFIKILQLMKK